MAVTITTINRGTVPGDGTGDTAYVGTGHINDNFSNLKTAVEELQGRFWTVQNSATTLALGKRYMANNHAGIALTMPATFAMSATAFNGMWVSNNDDASDVTLTPASGDEFYLNGAAQGADTTVALAPGELALISPRTANTNWDVVILSRGSTTIAGITGTKAEYDTSCTDGDFAFAGGAYHDGFSDYVAAEHINWSVTGAEDVHVDRIAAGAVTQHQGSIDHDQLLNFTSTEHFTKASILLDDLGDVVETTITTGDLLRWNGSNWVNYADSNYESADATILKEADVDDTPVDAATTAPISSNWAYDHAADAVAHYSASRITASTSTPSVGDFLKIINNTSHTCTLPTTFQETDPPIIIQNIGAQQPITITPATGDRFWLGSTLMEDGGNMLVLPGETVGFYPRQDNYEWQVCYLSQGAIHHGHQDLGTKTAATDIYIDEADSHYVAIGASITLNMRVTNTGFTQAYSGSVWVHLNGAYTVTAALPGTSTHEVIKGTAPSTSGEDALLAYNYKEDEDGATHFWLEWVNDT